MRLVRNARIEDDGGPLELQHDLAALTPQQVGETIRLMLEKNPTLLAPGSLAQLGSMFGASRGDSEQMLLRVERTEERRRPAEGRRMEP